MSTASGYILVLRGPRARAFEEQTQVHGPYFAEAVPDFEYSRTVPLICLISTDGADMNHIALGARGQQAGTNLRRLNLSGIHRL